LEIYYTDNEGKGYLSINGENDGDYKVIISYDGNNKYNGCTAEQTITIEDGTSTNTKNTTSNSTQVLQNTTMHLHHHLMENYTTMPDIISIIVFY